MNGCTGQKGEVYGLGKVTSVLEILAHSKILPCCNWPTAGKYKHIKDYLAAVHDWLATTHDLQQGHISTR